MMYAIADTVLFVVVIGATVVAIGTLILSLSRGGSDMAAPAAMRRRVTCERCGHSGDVTLPIRARLRCSGCGHVQVIDTTRRRHPRSIVGVVRFKRPAAAVTQEHVPDFDDTRRSVSIEMTAIYIPHHDGRTEYPGGDRARAHRRVGRQGKRGHGGGICRRSETD